MLFKTTANDAGLRLDVFISKQLPDVSRSRIQSWIKLQGDKPSRILKAFETIQIKIPKIQETALQAQELPLEILYEDDYLLVIHKPAGLVVHPGAGNPDQTLVNALLYRFPDFSVGDKKRPGIVHRLDKNTSGLMIIAKNDFAHLALTKAFQDRQVKKIYRALCKGIFKQSRLILKTGHKRHPTNRKRFTTKYPTEKMAHSELEVVAIYSGYTELKIEIFTGRTHQIRAQLADIGHPILGDTLYGGPKVPNFDRHALHAEELEFEHPKTGQKMHFQVQSDFATWLFDV